MEHLSPLPPRAEEAHKLGRAKVDTFAHAAMPCLLLLDARREICLLHVLFGHEGYLLFARTPAD